MKKVAEQTLLRDRSATLCTLNYYFYYVQKLTFSCTARIEIYFFHERLVYLINILVAIYFSQFLLLVVVFEHLDSLIKVDDQSSAHCFSSIIRALVELTSIKITYAIYHRGMIFDMVDLLSRLTEKSTSKPLE